MHKFFELLFSQKQLLQQRREIQSLRKEVLILQTQNESMRAGMRRCVTCDYRIDYKNRQGDVAINSDKRDIPSDDP